MFTWKSGHMNKIVFVIFLCCFGFKSVACQCVLFSKANDEEIAKDMYKSSEFVFVTKILSSHRLSQIEADTTTHHNFEVLELFKGKPSSMPFLRSGSQMSSSCDDNLTTNRKYLVFTNSNRVWNCAALPLDASYANAKNIIRNLDLLKK